MPPELVVDLVDQGLFQMVVGHFPRLHSKAGSHGLAVNPMQPVCDLAPSQCRDRDESG